MVVVKDTTPGSIITLPCSGSLEILVPWVKDLIDGELFDPEDFDPNDWRFGYGHNGPKIVGRDYNKPTFPIDWSRIKFKPSGFGARIVNRSCLLPTPTTPRTSPWVFLTSVLFETLVGTTTSVTHLNPAKAFPSIYIPGYNGTPVPVLDRETGEFVAVLTNAASWDPKKPDPSAAAIPDDKDVGILTDDPNFNIVLGSIFVQNTGFAYENPEFCVIDKDTGRENGKVKATIQEGRIVELEVVDVGTNFKRIPEIRVKNANADPGYGVKVSPIMNVVPRDAVPLPQAIETIYCPAKNQQNYTEIR